MILKKLLPAVALLLCSAASSGAQQQQERCTLKVENAPELRGFRLGMTVNQFKARFPGVVISDAEFGMQGAHVAKKDGEGLEGISRIGFEFVDGRLTAFQANYANSINWDSQEQFTERVGESLKLPKAWQGGDTMICDGFTITAGINSISMVDASGRRLVEQRRRERDEKARQGFRP
ncbi:MAG TPA: hypothetical protein VM934_18450 [Pyrinomonadaceae bacterium]|nr:hypothetical protein [Pyrinomonadaceae bacterium]